MVRRPSRTSLPLLLAIAAFALALLAPGSPLAAALLLFVPGWGLLRVLSVLDRSFGVLGMSLVLSPLVLAGVVLAARALHLTPAELGPAVHVATLGLCLAGRLRLAVHDRWSSRQPPHPAPMPLLPARTWLCVALAGLALAAVLVAEPPGRPAPGTPQLGAASRALAWRAGTGSPTVAGEALPATAFFSAAAGGLVAGSGVHPVVAVRLVACAALLACLLLVAESISRLWGNRGAPLAMLALLLGLNPLAGLFLLGAGDEPDLATRLTAGFDTRLTTALAPFLDGSSLSLTLAFVSALLFATLSVLRRASTHVPRLVAASSAGLVLADPRAALLLLPPWLVGLSFAWFACRRSPDNDPVRNSNVRRAGEPLRLRAPFWRPALHLLAGALPAALLVEAPTVDFGDSRIVAWGLTAALGPGCLLFVPGVRHLNRSPGREAWFFVGAVSLAVVLGLTVRFPGDSGNLVVRLLALLLAPAAANGAMKIVAMQGHRARLLILVLLVAALPGPILVLRDAAERPRPLVAGPGPAFAAAALPDDLSAALAAVAQSSPPDAVLLLDVPLPAEWTPVAHLLARRPLVVAPADTTRPERKALVEQLAAGDGLALARLRTLPGLAERPLWAVHGAPGWSGFGTVARHGELLVERTAPPDVILVTVSGLRRDRLDADAMPHLAAAAASGLLLSGAVTPTPQTEPGLASLLTGLSPVEHDLRTPGRRLPAGLPTLEERFAARGYRTAAVVGLQPGAGLLVGFDEQIADPGADAALLVDRALEQLGRADPRPLLLWLHLSDLQLPYELGEGYLFPADRAAEEVLASVAAFPPAPRHAPTSPELDTQAGIAAYDAVVARVDTELARLLDSLPADDLLLLTAPHGTGLDEHQAWFHHGGDLFEPSLQVPLLLLGGGVRAGDEPRLASLEDVAALLLEGRLPERERVLLESGRRAGLGTGATYPPELDPTVRGRAPRIWGERTAGGKTLLTVPPGPGSESGGVRFDLLADPDEMRALPPDPFVLRRIDSWRRRGRPPSGLGAGLEGG